MSADLSRERFDPRRDFAGVILQQGRLLLDADFNELVRLLDRRLRAETVDVASFGPDPDHAGSSWVPRQTPDGFRITLSGDDLDIGRGRMYVDGLLAENHGAEPWTFDGLLAEQVGTGAVTYTTQPYWPTPDDLPTSGRHLVYLDVWQREVTHIEDPDLVEVAVGVDTTARLQTVWQVRLHDLSDSPNTTCATADADIAGWPAVVAPAAGRATITTVPVDEEDDPCELPPTGGYRGLENQTYRVEIHAGGAPGTATFKWSRENASVVMAVTEMIDTTELRVATIGRDDVLRLSTGDWVEVTDDRRELAQIAGEMRQVTVDDAARTVSFTTPLPADLQPASSAEAAERHLRVRRWDQSGPVTTAGGATLPSLGSTGGVITVPATATTQVVLESGLAVSFDTEGSGGFRPGDHWIVAARSGQPFEGVTDAPPVGIHHHIARLGVVQLGANPTVSDCRRLWPPLQAEGGGEGCDCTLCVTPDSHASGELTIQQALDELADTGGTVCLHAGLYDVGEGVVMSGAGSVRLHGQGFATVLVARGDGVTVADSTGVELDHLAVVSGASARGAVRLRNTAACRVHDVVALALGEGSQRGSALHLEGVQLDLVVDSNILVGRWGIGCGTQVSDNVTIGIYGAVVRVHDNLVAGDGGISLGEISAFLASAEVRSNDVLAGDLEGILCQGAAGEGAVVRVADNLVWARGTGIVVGADGVVDGNTVTTGAEELEEVGAGIVVEEGFPAGPGDVRVTGNRVSRRGGPGIALSSPVRTWTVKQNVVELAASGIVVDDEGSAESLSVDNNHVRDVGPVAGALSTAGIVVARAQSATVSGNSVRRVGTSAVEARVRAGILALGVERLVVATNTVEEVGPQGFVGIAAGILVTSPFEQATLTANDVRARRDGEPVEGNWFAIVVQSSSRSVADLGEGRAVVPLGEESLVVTGRFAANVSERTQHVTLSANSATGSGLREGVVVRVGGDVVASANQVDHVSSGQPVAASLGGRTVAAATNAVRGPESMLVLEPADEVAFTAVGNVTAGGTHLFGPGNGLPGPWDPLNVTVP